MSSGCAGCRSTLLGCSRLSLALFLDRHMVTHCAAYYGTGNGVVTCDMAADAADCRAAKASCGIGWRRGGERNKKAKFHSGHGVGPEMSGIGRRGQAMRTPPPTELTTQRFQCGESSSSREPTGILDGDEAVRLLSNNSCKPVPGQPR